MEYTAVCTDTLVRNNQNLLLNVCRDETENLKEPSNQDRLTSVVESREEE